MKVVYIAGKFRGESRWDEVQNIRDAELYALRVWEAGAVALCPHLNTANFQGHLPNETWLKGDLFLLEKCDAIFMVPGWVSSEGSVFELQFAIEHNIPVFYHMSALRSWLNGGDDG